jgi:N-acetylglucosamine kinase-like BadF-type ATPase
MTKALLGIDGGGTKTHAVLADLDGNILGSAANGGANWERIGLKAVTAGLQELIAIAITNAGITIDDIVGSTFALAGIDWDEDKSMFASTMPSLKLSGAIHLMNDSFAALYAGIPNGIGIVSIAGTGGKTTGHDGVTTVQTMGMDLGEAGGAGQLLALCLDSIARMHHGITPKSEMFTVIPETLGYSDMTDFFTAIARDRISLDESLAPLIFDLAISGDVIASENVIKVAKQHALDVFGIYSRLKFDGEGVAIIRAGGLHTAGCQIFDLNFEDEVRRLIPKAAIEILGISPVFGAVLSAAHNHFTSVPDTFSTHLLTQAKEVLLQ